jgi:starch synthase
VHTVSPTYAKEIQQRSQADVGIYGGEGLELDLQQRAEQGLLFGILNGCDYPNAEASKPSKADIVSQARKELMLWAGKEKFLSSAHWLAEKNLEKYAKSKRKDFIISSIGRLTEQKARLLLEPCSSGKLALDEILSALGNKGRFIFIGSGDAKLELEIQKFMASHENFIFLNGFSPKLADMLYTFGELFLMPSSFEPCGISQLLSMRSGQPCLVHEVGGLKDTVRANDNGFSFKGDGLTAQADNFVSEFESALKLKLQSNVEWERIVDSAKATRILWRDAAVEYLQSLYV